jgi:hypothetical protein
VHYSYNQDGTPSLSNVDRDKDALERFTDPSQLSD